MYPQVLIDSQGNIVFVWRSAVGNEGGKLVLKKYDSDYIPITDERVIATPTQEFLSIDSFDAAIDSRGNVYTTWVSSPDIYQNSKEIFLGITNTEGGNPRVRRITSYPSTWPRDPVIATHSNMAHVAWIESDPQAPYAFLHLAALDNQGSIIRERVLEVTSANARELAIAIDPQGYIRLVWVAQSFVGGAYFVYYAKVDSQLNVVQTRQVSDRPSYVATGPGIAVDSQGNSHIVWKDNPGGLGLRELYYEKINSDGETIINDRSIIGEGDYLAKIAVDYADNLNIFTWSGGTWGGGSIRYLYLDNNANRIVNLRTVVPYGGSLPDVAISRDVRYSLSGTIHMAYNIIIPAGGGIVQAKSSATRAGLAVVGTPTPGGTLRIMLSDREHPNLDYRVIFAFLRNGFPLGPRMFPLSADSLLYLSVLQLLGFPNSGQLDGEGQGSILVPLPNVNRVGFYVTFATTDPQLGIVSYAVPQGIYIE